MRLSLIVCTRNRATALPSALQAFAEIPPTDEWELVLVNNGSSDGTAAILHDFAQDAPCRVVVVDEPAAGLSRARNRGLSVAKGELLAFTDDDCYPSPDFVSTILARFSDTDIGYLGGRVLLHDPADLPITIQELDREVQLEPRSFIKPGLIHGANMAFRKAALEEIGGFDERLGAGAPFKSGEDTDAIARCSTLGYAGAFAPEVVVQHHHGRKTEEEARALRSGYAIGRGVFMLKQCADKRSRSLYARQWYWRLRDESWSVRVKELSGALKFLTRCRFLPSRILRHPNSSLSGN